MPAGARGGGTGELGSPAPGYAGRQRPIRPQGFETVWLWRRGGGARVDGLLVGAPGSLPLLFPSPVIPVPPRSQVLSGILRGMEPPRVRAGWLGEGRRRRPGTRACGLCGARPGGVSSRAKAGESSQSSLVRWHGVAPGPEVGACGCEERSVPWSR